MIKFAKIEGFKCFKSLELPSVSRITLLGGKNNVGKTAVMEALFLFFDRLNPIMTVRQLGWRGVDKLLVNPDTVFEPFFRNFNIKEEMTISIINEKEKEKMTVKFNPHFSHESINAEANAIRTDQNVVPASSLDIIYNTETKKNQRSHLVLSPKGLTMIKGDAMSETRPVTFFSARHVGAPSEDANRFSYFEKNGKVSYLLKFLKVVEPRLNDLSLISEGDVSLIYGDIGLGKKIPLRYLGDGVSRLLSIIMGIAATRNGTVFIDECENGFHYSVMAKIWKEIAEASREFNCQIFCTTHSYECLQAAYEGLKDEFQNDFTYTRLDEERDEIVANIFNLENLRIAFELGMEVR